MLQLHSADNYLHTILNIRHHR